MNKFMRFGAILALALSAVAKAEAEAINIKGEALRNNANLVDLTIAEKWDGKLPEQYLGGGGNDGKILQIMRK